MENFVNGVRKNLLQAFLKTALTAHIEELVLGLSLRSGLDLLHHLHNPKREGLRFRWHFLAIFPDDLTF
jgi:hypothetical protein